METKEPPLTPEEFAEMEEAMWEFVRVYDWNPQNTPKDEGPPAEETSIH